jgi:hypothetical protein
MASVLTEVRGSAPKRKFVIEWRNVTFSLNGIPDGVNRIDFEIVLYETGQILLQYRNIDNSLERGSSATIGVENATGDAAAQFSCNTAALGTGEFAILFGNVVKDVPVDIMPRHCPNPLNLVIKGVLPVAILGTADFDVKTIDPTTVNLKGVAPLRWSLIKDVATPYEPFVGKTDIHQCNTLGPDGNLDLMLMFDTEEVAAAIGDFDVFILELGGQLRDGTEIKGEDSVLIISGHHKKEHHKKEHHKKEHHKKEHHKKEHEKKHEREKEK